MPVYPGAFQKHDYPSKAHRRSYARRTGAERTFSTAQRPRHQQHRPRLVRLTGLAPIMLWLACLLVTRNQRILDAWDARQADDARRAAAGLPPRTRRRRRKTLTDLATAGTPPDPAGTRTAPPGGTLTGPTQTPASQASRHLPENIPAGTPQPANHPRRPRTQNVRPKREHRCRSNVKTFWSPVTESNRRPSPYHGSTSGLIALGMSSDQVIRCYSLAQGQPESARRGQAARKLLPEQVIPDRYHSLGFRRAVGYHVRSPGHYSAPQTSRTGSTTGFTGRGSGPVRGIWTRPVLSANVDSRR